ncbi:hypothetical protein GCM10022243_51460 [Saccharothrix violaceirubra]|uniref:Uncharacterized protein n=1 Tax=Saccharothrix violaceirubra TaxID=413306 RepID=A0A7W7TAI3_9PSEU|nr:hypothetical protein [Saccharothrix violaceirubra]MBB4969553.1 hypothetical protein [Saccharothrix violaceirubra]
MGTADPRRSLFVCCDLRSYGAADDGLQRELQELLVGSLDRAGAAAGLDRSRWTRQPKGDEEWAVLPSTEPERRVVDDYVRALDRELSAVNKWRVPAGRLRMRLALHHGVVVEGANGFPGQDPVLVSRLLNCSAARRALEQFPEAALVVVLSDHLYSSMVRPGHTTLRPEDFRRIDVVEKTFTGQGWLWIPNGDAHALILEERDSDQGRVPAGQHATATGGSTVFMAGRDVAQHAEVIQNFSGNDQRGSHFGTRRG